MSHGIKETKELVKFVCELGGAFDKALEDKKLSVADVPLLIAPLMSMGQAFDGMNLVAKEMGDLDSAEKSELIAYVQDELELRNDKVEEIIEKALIIGGMIYDFVSLFKKEEA